MLPMGIVMCPAELCNTLSGWIFYIYYLYEALKRIVQGLILCFLFALFCGWDLGVVGGRGDGVLKIFRINYEQSNSTAKILPLRQVLPCQIVLLSYLVFAEQVKFN